MGGHIITEWHFQPISMYIKGNDLNIYLSRQRKTSWNGQCGMESSPVPQTFSKQKIPSLTRTVKKQGDEQRVSHNAATFEPNVGTGQFFGTAITETSSNGRFKYEIAAVPIQLLLFSSGQLTHLLSPR